MAYQTPEQIAATALSPLGFLPVNNVIMPYQFVDKDGTNFRAMADFYHPDLDLYVEVKCNHLNGKTSKMNAEKAYNRIDPVRLRKSPTYHQIQTQWNHAAAKQAVVQSTIGHPQFAVVFTKEPDEATIKRIEKQGIQALSLKRFVSILTLQLAVSSM
jgi:hypothetical protein